MFLRIALAAVLLLGLSGLASTQDIASLAQEFEKAAPAQQEALVRRIAALRSEASRAWLVKTLNDTQESTRRVGLIAALGIDGHDSNASILESLITTSAPTPEAVNAISALSRLKTNSIPFLARFASTTTDQSLLAAAVNAIGRAKTEAALDALVALAKTSNAGLTNAALSALGRNWPSDRFFDPVIIPLLDSEEPAVVTSIVSLLARERSPKVYVVVVRFLENDKLKAYRRNWVSVLARLDTVEAVELMETLANEGGPALASFQKALSTMNSKEVLQWARTRGVRSAIDGVREIVEQRLLATGDDADAPIALRRARSKDSEVAIEAIAALAKFRTTAVAAALESLLNHRDPAIAATALESRWIQQGGTADVEKETAAAAMNSTAWQIRLIALELLTQRATAHESVFVKNLTHKNPLVRGQAYDALTFIRDKRIVTLLIDRIPKEKDRRAGEALASALFDLTNFDYGLSEEQWKKWWALMGDEYPLPEKPKVKKQTTTGQSSGYARYYGIDVKSDRVAFVIDVSGSMRGQGTGASKLQRAKDNLIGVLKNFPKSTRFNIIAFHTVLVPFGDQLLPATSGRKSEATEWVQKLEATGGTNIYDSLMRALDQPEVDTVFLLSDGAPSAGEFTDTDEILKRVRQKNRLRRIRIHTVGIGISGPTADFMARLAEENFGQSARN